MMICSVDYCSVDKKSHRWNENDGILVNTGFCRINVKKR